VKKGKKEENLSLFKIKKDNKKKANLLDFAYILRPSLAIIAMQKNNENAKLLELTEQMN